MEYEIVEDEDEIRIESANDIVCRMGARRGDTDDDGERAAQIHGAQIIVNVLKANCSQLTAS